MKRFCQCPLTSIMSDCPFSHANGWHEQRRQVLLRTKITPKLRSQIEEKRKTMSDELFEAV